MLNNYQQIRKELKIKGKYKRTFFLCYLNILNSFKKCLKEKYFQKPEIKVLPFC